MKNTISNFFFYNFSIIIGIAGIVISLTVLSFFINILPFIIVIAILALVAGAYITYNNIATSRYVRRQNSLNSTR